MIKMFRVVQSTEEMNNKLYNTPYIIPYKLI